MPETNLLFFSSPYKEGPPQRVLHHLHGTDFGSCIQPQTPPHFYPVLHQFLYLHQFLHQLSSSFFSSPSCWHSLRASSVGSQTSLLCTSPYHAQDFACQAIYFIDFSAHSCRFMTWRIPGPFCLPC